MILVGGLGGGGDSGGSLSVAIALKQLGLDVSILGVLNCHKHNIVNAKVVAGSLLEINPASWSSGRFFEPHIASLGWRVYSICIRDGLNEALEGLEKIVDDLNVKAFIGVDFGGDIIVKGDEPDVGSTTNDSMALALLVEAKRKLGLKTLLGVGVLGGEFGGCIPMPLLVENVLEIVKSGGYLGAYKPKEEVRRKFLGTAGYLLSRVPSLMLTIYTDALKNRLGRNFYSVAYFRGKFEVRKYHKYIFFFNPDDACKVNRFCQVALRKRSFRKVRDAVKSRERSRRKGLSNWEKILDKLIKKPWRPESLMNT